MSAKQLLLFPILIAFALIPVFADDENLIIQTDRAQYHTGEEMTVSGFILEKKMPVIAMSMYDPDGTVISANSVEIDELNAFSRTTRLDSPFFDKPGIYLIKFNYGKTKAETTFEVLNDQPKDEVKPDTKEIIIPEVLTLDTGKPTYQDGDFITISGTVSAIGEPSVLVGIYDPFGTPAGFYFGDIGSDLGFSVSFLAKSGVNFKTPGSYTVKAHYGESKREISFGFTDITEPHENPNQNPVPVKKPEDKSAPKIDIPSQYANPQITEPKKPETPKIQEKEPEVQDNLTVKDIELGKMLNEIALNCDNSEYVDSISYYDGMGPALMRLCKYDSALTFFDRMLEADPENVEVLTNKGSALAKLGQYSEAVTHYDLALRIQPNYLPAMNNKANALAELGDFGGAISLYNSVLDHEPTFVVAQDNLEKARERLLLFTKNEEQKPVQEDHVVNVSKELPKIADSVEHEEKPSNILEQIGNVFSFLSANVFGFMK